MRILNSQVWAQGLFCDMLTKRKIFFSRHLPSFFHFHGKLFQGASWKATQNQCVLKATSLMTDKRVMREFLHLFFNRDLEKPNDWERAWFILCKCWSVCLTVTYCILQRYLFKSSPKYASTILRREKKLNECFWPRQGVGCDHPPEKRGGQLRNADHEPAAGLPGHL